jgi:hypothetical protein
MSPWENFWDIFWISKAKEPPDAGAVSAEELERIKNRVLV